jgi:ATP-binding protein involved in chromosome partitioning
MTGHVRIAASKSDTATMRNPLEDHNRTGAAMLRFSRHGLNAEVREAVEAVADPELHRPLGQLGMVRSVSANRSGKVAIEIALTTAGCPMRERLTRDVTAAAVEVVPAARVEVSFTTMEEDQRRSLARDVLNAARVSATAPAQAVYAVASGKGGVGKSTVAANLAVALARQGKVVGLIDTDVWGYSIPQVFGVRRKPVAMYEKMLPVQAHGVRLMSMGFFTEDEQPIVWRGPMLHKALTEFVRNVHWGELDVLLLDLPPGTGDVTLSVLELLPDAALLAVTTPQPAARSVAGRVGAMARDVRMPIAGVIENMSELVCPHCDGRAALFGSGGGARLATDLGVDLLGQIPLDMAVRIAGDDGEPIVITRPDSPAAAAIAGIATALRPARRGLAGRPLSLTVVPHNPPAQNTSR